MYSDELKTKFADVPAKLIEKHGAVVQKWRSRWQRESANAAPQPLELVSLVWRARREDGREARGIRYFML